MLYFDGNEFTNNIPREFKEAAGSLVRDQGNTVPEVTKSLGLPSTSVILPTEDRGR